MRGTQYVTRSYLVVAAVLIGAMAVQTANRQWSLDWSWHAATVRELAARPFHPHHPLIGTRALDPDSSPYLFALGLVVRVTGLSVAVVLSLAAMLNLLLFLVALPLFVRCFSARRNAATWALIFILVLWGIDPWRWSGYLNLNSIGFGLPYPSMAAFALTLFAIVLLHTWCLRPRLSTAIGTGVLGSLAALIHPPTATGAGIAALAVLIWKWNHTTARAWRHLVAAGVIGAVVLAAWPLYHFFALFGGALSYVEATGRRQLVLPRVILMLVALPALWVRWRRDRRDALVLLFIGAVAVLIPGGLYTQKAVGRTLPFAALAAQVALADEVSRRIEEGSQRVAVAAASLAVVGVAFCAPALPRFIPRALLPSSLGSRNELASVTSGYGFLGVVPRDDVVAVQSSRALGLEPVFGGKAVSPGHPAPFVHDLRRRELDERGLFTARDERERSAIIARYQVQWLLLDRKFANDPKNAALISRGRVAHRDRLFTLVRLN